MDEPLPEIEQVTKDVMEAMLTAIDRLEPPERRIAVLLGIAATTIARNMGESEPNAGTINATWAEAGFPWRMVRLQ